MVVCGGEKGQRLQEDEGKQSSSDGDRPVLLLAPCLALQTLMEGRRREEREGWKWRGIWEEDLPNLKQTEIEIQTETERLRKMEDNKIRMQKVKREK